MTDLLERIEQKLDDIALRLTKVEACYEHTCTKIDEIHDKHLLPLIKSVSDNQRKIAEIEIEIAKIKTKLGSLGVIAVIISSTVISIIIKNIMESK